MSENESQAPKTALVLRCCAADMSSQNGFIWPGVGEVAEAPDWQDNDQCGAGLHGWLYGQGDHSSSNYALSPDAKWLVVEVDLAGVRMLGGKCKFQRGTVRFVGSRSEAAAYLIANEPQAANVAVIGAVLECGDNQQVQGGALSVLTGGYRATMTGGDSATMTGGYRATMTGGNYATMTGGNYATMHFQYWDGTRNRTVIAYVGEDGIEANTPYRLGANHKPQKVTE